MALTVDQHIHSYFSGDSKTPMKDMIEAAIAKGLTCITFTEHMDYDYPESEHDPAGKFEVNTDSYLYELLVNRALYKDRIKILFGIELGLQPDIIRKNLLYIKNYNFDFVIGSAHLCNKKDPYYPSFFEGRSEKEAFAEYFECVVENIKAFSNFDVFGHLDYIVRYCPTKTANYSYSKYADYIDTILKLLIEKEKGLEANTGAFRNGLSEPNPNLDILKRYKELGGEILTIGSDAHSPEYIGDQFEKTASQLKECGFKYYCLFEDRMPEYKLL